MRLRHLNGLERAAYLAGTPVLPFLLFARTVRTVLPKRRFNGKLAMAAPIIFLAVMSWSIGELIGYLCGTGTSCCHVR